MAQGNFDACLALTLRFEGGYSDHPADPGGATNFGITRATLAQERGRAVSKEEVRALPRSEAAQIYRRRFWTGTGAEDLPSGVDAFVFDYGVNSGPPRALRALQNCLHVGATGEMDAATWSALAQADPAALIRAMARQRQSFVERLSTFRVFGRGWSARVAALQAASLAMCADAQGKASATGVPRRSAPDVSQIHSSQVQPKENQMDTKTTTSFATAAKPFWASQTIWSAVAVIGSSVAGAWLAWKSGDMAALTAALAAVLGGANTIAGRVRASTSIE